MTNIDARIRSFAIELFKINALKFGEFKMKIGLMSPIYCDLRVVISYPKLMDELSQLLITKIDNIKDYKLLCGVPYTALPIATAMSMRTHVPMILRRKEAKNYGTKKLIEGNFESGDRCLIIEDIVTSGSSILETVHDLNDVGIKATDAIVVLNREQGGEDNLNKNGVKIHSLLTITKLLRILFEEKYIDEATETKVLEYLRNTQVKDITQSIKHNRLKMSFEERSKHSKNSIGIKLFNIITTKQTNLCVALDLCSSTKILNLAEQLGPHVCIIKLHVDIIEDFTQEFANKLKTIAQCHNFLIMEDRKFADIGNTIALQFGKGIYKISNWANLVTAHSLSGKGLIQALEQTGSIEKGIFLVAEMSSAGNLINENYTESTIGLAKEFNTSVAGLVCQNPKFLDVPELIQLTPGIQLNKSGDNLGQQYNSPEYIVLEKGADIGVVGRGITEAENPVTAAENYKNLLWNAYLKRIENN